MSKEQSIPQVHWVEFEHIIRNTPFKLFKSDDNKGTQTDIVGTHFESAKTWIITMLGCKLFADTNKSLYNKARNNAITYLELIKAELSDVVHIAYINKLLIFIEFNFPVESEE